MTLSENLVAENLVLPKRRARRPPRAFGDLSSPMARGSRINLARTRIPLNDALLHVVSRPCSERSLHLSFVCQPLISPRAALTAGGVTPGGQS